MLVGIRFSWVQVHYLKQLGKQLASYLTPFLFPHLQEESTNTYRAVSGCKGITSSVQFSSLSRVWLFATPWTAVHQASLFITNSGNLLKLMSIESVMPSSHLTFCRPLLLPPSVFPSIRVISNESALCIRWAKYWCFSFNISPSNGYSGLISFRMDWLNLLLSKGLSRVFSNTTVQKRQFFSAQLSSQSKSPIHTWPLEKP